MTDQPDGFMIAHHGANFSVYFGPFANIQEARQFYTDHPDVRGAIYPLFLTVDWNRGIE